MKIKFAFLASVLATLALLDVLAPGANSPLISVARAQSGDTEAVLYRLPPTTSLSFSGFHDANLPWDANPVRKIHFIRERDADPITVPDCANDGTTLTLYGRAAIATAQGQQPVKTIVYYSLNADGSDPFQAGDLFVFAAGQTDEASCCMEDYDDDGTFVLTSSFVGGVGACPDINSECGGGACDGVSQLRQMHVTKRSN